MGFYEQLGHLGPTCIQKYPNDRHVGRENPFFEPPYEPKGHSSVITAQKRFKTNENSPKFWSPMLG